MNKDEYNKCFLKCSLQGSIDVNIYDEENKLKRTIKGKNVLTQAGVNRLIEMLVDGYDYFKPKLYQDLSDDTSPMPTLKDNNNFDGGHAGEIFGINVIEWPGRYKSTFTQHGFQNSSYFDRTDNMFQVNYDSASRWYNNYQDLQYWTPGGEDSGFICDLGWTEVTNEIFNAPTDTQFYNVANKNLYYDYMVVKNMAETVTYVEDTDYQWTTGDGDNYGQIKILNGSLVGTNLKISYRWYDVPQVPIVGFAIRAGGSSWGCECFFHAWRWSLNQGESRTESFFPFVNGVPAKQGWEYRYSDLMWHPVWHATSNPYTYFFNSLPWAVKNPVQLAWFGNHKDQQKHIWDFQLLGLKMPKLGCHAIGLGIGAGTPEESDTALFNLQEKITTEQKYRNGTSGLKIVSHLDYDEGNGKTFTEAGMYYPSDESAYFKVDEYWSGSADEGFSGEHYDNISGTNKILKLSTIDPDDCDSLMSHAMFDESWSKTSAERAEIVYNLSVYWG